MSMLSKLAEIVIGTAIVLMIVNDVFQTVIVPRAVGRRWRASAYWTRWMWRGCLAVTQRLNSSHAREIFLSRYAPVALVATMVFWVALLIFGYGTIFYALRDEIKPLPSYWDAVYFAGTSLITIGYGDVVATAGPARFFAILSGATGFAVVAIVTSYLFALFGSFQTREVFVMTLGTRASSPPSGVELLLTHARLGLMESLPDLFKTGETWTAQVMESHLAYPMLPYFRSSHDYESWVATLGALLDAAALMMTTVRDRPAGEARLMHAMGRHAVHDLAKYFGLPAGDATGVDRPEFDAARQRLIAAGLRCFDADDSWAAFALLRSTYAARLNGLARYLDIPPAQWIGDRSLIGTEHGALTVDLRAQLLSIEARSAANDAEPVER
jgi:hypothetical protein